MSLKFQKITCIIISVIFLFMFSSCSKSDNDLPEETIKTSNVDYKSIYREYLINNYDDIDYVKFGLFYIDSDSVPELVLNEYSGHGGTAGLFTIVDNQVKYIGCYGSFGGFQFGEKTGIVLSYYFRNGGINRYTFYKLENGVADYLWGGYDQAFLDYDYEKPNQYFIFETDPYDEDENDLKYRTSKDSFESQLNEYLDIIDTDTTSNCGMFEITLENINYYFDNYGTTGFSNKLYQDSKTNIIESLEAKHNTGGLGTYYYFCDLNNDGYGDIVYFTEMEDPCVGIYREGEFRISTIESEVKLGSLFPSGVDSGLYIDADKGILIYRYGGHTTGTLLEHGAEAFEIFGKSIRSAWIVISDSEKYYSEYPNEEDIELASVECLSEFNEIYSYMTEGLNLVNFFEVCESFE